MNAYYVPGTVLGTKNRELPVSSPPTTTENPGFHSGPQGTLIGETKGFSRRRSLAQVRISGS